MSSEIVSAPMPTCKQFQDLTGLTFGRWFVVAFLGCKITGDGKKMFYWECRCACGTIKPVGGMTLRAGSSTSCGCLQARHRQSKTPIYHIWNSMQYRCFNENCPKELWDNYGGRGITVEDVWRVFENFRDWAFAHGYAKGLEIDRIDVNGNYGPGNCRFVVRTINAINRRPKGGSSKFGGVSFDKKNKNWRASGSLNGKNTNLGRYDTEIEAALARDAFYDIHYPNQFQRNLPKPEPTQSCITEIAHCDDTVATQSQ